MSQRRRRHTRGVTLVEYVVLLTFVVLPCVAGALLCYQRILGYYLRFVAEVSQPTP